jgi:fructose 1,6-bisphosphate aldolase/phosphatase
LLTHQKGVLNEKIHKLCWDAFLAGTKVAKEQGLYGAGQDLLVEAFSGNVRGMGPQVAEMEIEERPSEPFLLFMADKTEPGAFNLPLYLAFADPMHCAGLILSPKIKKGFKFVIMDVSYTEADRVIELVTPEETYDIAALLRDTGRFVVESIWSRASGEQAVAASTTRLHNIAGKYVGKDDPVMLVRTQHDFPATGEILSPYTIGHFVAGFMRGSHNGPLLPVKKNSSISYFDGPPVISCLAFSMKNGKLTEPVDCFDQPYWDYVRMKVSQKAEEIRKQGFSGPAMLQMTELEYTGVMETLKELEKRFKIRKK